MYGCIAWLGSAHALIWPFLRFSRNDIISYFSERRLEKSQKSLEFKKKLKNQQNDEP
jgi:hypothetical protein